MTKRIAKTLTWQGQIEKAAREVAALQRQRRNLRKKLREVDAEWKKKRREFRTLTAAFVVENAPDTPPMRLFGERQVEH